MRVRVEVVNRTRVRLPATYLRNRAQRIARAIGRRGRWQKERYALTIVFVSDGESKRLNAKFRKRPKAANVLAFDYGSAGELILTPGLIRREARSAGEPFRLRLAALVVHGMLHLAGFHHEGSPSLAKKFEQGEQELFRRLGIG